MAVYASPRQTVVAGPTEAVEAVIASGHPAEHVRPQGQRGSRVSPRDDGSHPAGVAGGVGWSGAEAAAHPGHQHSRECRCRTAVRCRSLGGQRAQPGPVQPGRRRRRRHPRTFIEISPHPLLTKAISDTLDHPYRQRTSPQPRHAAARRSRHRRIPHQPQRHPHRPAAARRAPAGAAPRHPDHPWRHTRHWIDAAPAVSTNGFGVRSGPAAGRDGSASPGGLAVRADLARPAATGDRHRGRRPVAGSRGRRPGCRARSRLGPAPTGRVARRARPRWTTCYSRRPPRAPLSMSRRPTPCSTKREGLSKS